ncbi:MAG: Fe(3+) ABC transporter substrate-binding protein [Planctomycetota bacterium]
MTLFRRVHRIALTFAAACLLAPSAMAQGEVNVYSSRHYDTDDKLYALFTEKTGIEVNVIEGGADELLTRLNREGELSPGDVFIAVDAGRLQKAVDQGALQPVASDVLAERIPDELRHPDGLWFGLSKRARVIFLSDRVPANLVDSYESLADPYLGKIVLIRSSQNIYNQSLLASMIAQQGQEVAEAWAEGIVANMARTPQGGDTDQLRALAAGEGDIAVANHYYFCRMLERGNDADRAAAESLTLVFPNQGDRGTHVNVSGAGVLRHAPNRENAIALLEFLTTPEAQELYALANYEYPVVNDVELTPVLTRLGEFDADELNAGELGRLNREAVRTMDRAGWR